MKENSKLKIFFDDEMIDDLIQSSSKQEVQKEHKLSFYLRPLAFSIIAILFVLSLMLVYTSASKQMFNKPDYKPFIKNSTAGKRNQKDSIPKKEEVPIDTIAKYKMLIDQKKCIEKLLDAELNGKQIQLPCGNSSGFAGLGLRFRTIKTIYDNNALNIARLAKQYNLNQE